MTRALSRYTSLTKTLVITKHAPDSSLGRFRMMEGGHPVPDVRSLAAGGAALEFVSGLDAEDLLVCLISGGGSALMTAPTVPLEDLQSLTSALLASGARIDEINTLRRRIDRVKGGGLAKATKAQIVSLILSDVVGSPLEAIASGPTAPDPTTRENALSVLEKYFSTSLRDAAEGRRSNPLIAGSLKLIRRPVSIWRKNTAYSTNGPRYDTRIPTSIIHLLHTASETPRPGDLIFDRVQNVIVGDNILAAKAALEQAEREGFATVYLGSDWQGEAREVGTMMAEKLRVANIAYKQPYCLVAGGETTVTLLGDGHGGRNQELALAAVPALAGLQDVSLITLATDGEDGPTDAAGAVVTGETGQRAEALGLSAADYLSRNDAYPFFTALGDLIKIGPTGTNVNDLTFLFGFPGSN